VTHVPKDITAPVATVPAIYLALINVAAELAKAGIAKDRRNEQQNFQFRGIDEVMNAVSPILARHQVVLQIDYEDYPDVERVTAKGSTLIYSKVKGVYSFTSAVDGSSMRVTTFGVAMDSADKGMNKAMSAALKYCLLQTFLIPTEGDNDADATTPEASVAKPPDGFDDWFPAIVAVAEQGFDAIRDAWRDSPEDYRTYAMTYRSDEWTAAKKQATAVTKKRKAQADASAKAAK
jgi:hypothetical protein